MHPTKNVGPAAKLMRGLVKTLSKMNAECFDG